MTDQEEQNASQQADNENACVVCFKTTLIYSIGCCNHPVCFECSARMRCLCLQNECPICRQDLPKVIFTKSIEQFSVLDRHIRSGFFEKKYKIMFADMEIQKAFYHLLEHRCHICSEDQRPFVDFHKLKEHIRKVHERFFCEICTENLKIFSSERRSYTRQELAQHRRIGDPDNKSHKGHPRCDYCELRYLDKDELFRHLRREHYFCHLCDADGKNLYFGTVQEMRQHFKAEHFLCEEDDCITEEFTAVFRSEIDLRAHKATVHSRGMSKSEARQVRTVEVDFSYAPRGRQGQGADRRFTRDTQREFDNREIPEQQIVQQPPVKIDASSELQFPSLAPSASAGTSGQVQLANSVRHVVYGQAGIAKTRENFPTLGGGVVSDVRAKPTSSKQPPNKQPSASSLFKPSKSNNQKQQQQQNAPRSQNTAADFPTLPSNSSTKLSSTFMSHPTPSRPSVSSSSSTTPVKIASKFSDYPALPQNSSKSKAKDKLMEDMVESSGNVNKGLVSAKHRNLMNDYVSMASQLTKVQLIKQKEEVSFDNSQKLVPKLNSTNNFPTLATSSSSSSDQKLPQWITVKPPANKQPQKANNIIVPKVPQNKPQNMNGMKKPKDEKKVKEKPREVLSSKNSVPPPPGFNKSDVTFSKFTPPPEMAKRNEALMEELEKILKTHDQMQEFKVLSGLFRNGNYFARSYYESCKIVLGEKFDTVFPELIVLLPDIEKQQKLYRIHLEENGTESAGGTQGKRKKFLLDVCNKCQQVLLNKDLSQHVKGHSTENQIPKNLKSSMETGKV